MGLRFLGLEVFIGLFPGFSVLAALLLPLRS